MELFISWSGKRSRALAHPASNRSQGDVLEDLVSSIRALDSRFGPIEQSALGVIDSEKHMKVLNDTMTGLFQSPGIGLN